MSQSKEDTKVKAAAQHSVPPTGGSLHVFKQFSGLRLDAVKATLFSPADQQVTHTVGRLHS